MTYTRILIEDNEEGPEWAVIFYLPARAGEYDDAVEDDNSQVQIVLNAADINDAIKYAEQYIRVQADKDSDWDDAEIVSVDLR